MRKRIYTFLKQDMVNSLRDNILLYMIIAPILLSIGAKAFMPQVEQVGGVVKKDDGYAVILEGNESAASGEIARIIMSRALGEERKGSYTYLKTGEQDSSLIQYTTVLLIMMGALIGGLAASFNMIDEKESKAIQAAAVSPLRTIDYALSRGIYALLVSLVITAASTLILAGMESLPQILLAFLFTAPVPLILALIVGGFADNQIKAPAILKILLVVYLTIPVVSIFVAEKWQFFFYPLPNYWAFKVFESVLVEGAKTAGFWLSSLAAALLGSLTVGILMPFVSKKNFQG
jgi:ABC-2 type transport system permease protein